MLEKCITQVLSGLALEMRALLSLDTHLCKQDISQAGIQGTSTGS